MRRLMICSIALFVLVGCDAYGNPLQSSSQESAAAPGDATPHAASAAASEAVAESAEGMAVVVANCDVATIDLSGYPAGSHFIFGLGQQPPFGGTFDGSRTLRYTVGLSDLNASGQYSWSLRVNAGGTMTGQSGSC